MKTNSNNFEVLWLVLNKGQIINLESLQVYASRVICDVPNGSPGPTEACGKFWHIEVALPLSSYKTITKNTKNHWCLRFTSISIQRWGMDFGDLAPSWCVSLAQAAVSVGREMFHQPKAVCQFLRMSTKKPIFGWGKNRIKRGDVYYMLPVLVLRLFSMFVSCLSQGWGRRGMKVCL